MSENNQYPANDLNLCCFIAMFVSAIIMFIIAIFSLDYPVIETFIFVIGSTSPIIFLFTLSESDWFRIRE